MTPVHLTRRTHRDEPAVPAGRRPPTAPLPAHAGRAGEQARRGCPCCPAPPSRAPAPEPARPPRLARPSPASEPAAQHAAAQPGEPVHARPAPRRDHGAVTSGAAAAPPPPVAGRALAVLLVVLCSSRAAPRRRSTAWSRPAPPRRRTQQVTAAFLAAWQSRDLTAAANYTDSPPPPPRRWPVREGPEPGQVLGQAASVAAAPKSTARRAPGDGHVRGERVGRGLHAARPRCGPLEVPVHAGRLPEGELYVWFVGWAPDVVAPNLTASQHLAAVTVPPTVSEVTDADGKNLTSTATPAWTPSRAS